MKEIRYEIRLSGSGGQGIIMAAVVLAEAAGVYGRHHVCQTQSYGPEARGGDSKAEVIISNTEIDYPKALRLDLLLAMNQASCDAYFMDIRPQGLLVVDATYVEQVPTSRVVQIDFTTIARKHLGNELVANMVALGAVGHLCPLVSHKKLETALLARVPDGYRELNKKALAAGMRAAQKVDLDSLPLTIAPDAQDF